MSEAKLFAALGDETRLALVTTLARGEPRSITELTEGTKLTRQAVTKHLKILQGAGLVRVERTGREARMRLVPQPFETLQEYLEAVSRQWDDALARLKSLVES